MNQIECGIGLEWLRKIELIDDMDILKEEIAKKIIYLSDFEARAIQRPKSDVIQKVYLYICEHLDDPTLTLKSISENHLFMNVDYLSKKFQKEMGIKFSKYLTKVRIEKAKEYLKESPNLKIQDVAERIGYYNNPNYFSRVFKKEVGISPSAYIATIK